MIQILRSRTRIYPMASLDIKGIASAVKRELSNKQLVKVRPEDSCHGKTAIQNAATTHTSRRSFLPSQAVAFFAGAVIVSRNFGDSFAI